MAYVGTNSGENTADTMRAARVSACDTPMVSLFDSCGSSLVIEDDSIVLLYLYLSIFQGFLRNRATGMPKRSRYLATVRRAIGAPCSAINSQIRLSLKGSL